MNFDEQGHITEQGFAALAAGGLDAATRLRLAEHLAVCDACAQRYAAALETQPLRWAPISARGLWRTLRRRERRALSFRVAAMAGAACCALLLWSVGGFRMPPQGAPLAGGTQQLAEQIGNGTRELTRSISRGVDWLLSFPKEQEARHAKE